MATAPYEHPSTIVGAPFDYSSGVRPLCYELEDSSETRELAMEKKEFKVRLADNSGRRSSAGMLINKMYSWRGYKTNPKLNEDPNRITLVASDGDQAIGTLSINFDSGIGLLVDELYQTEVDEMRARGRKVCEFIKLAVDGEVKSKRVLGALFHIATVYARNIRKYTDLLIEVNPRHVRFYERSLGFRRLGPERLNTRVNAPAVLLWADLEYIHEQAVRFGGRPELAAVEKSFYPYYFSPAEEAGITNRLIQMDQSS